MKEKVTGYASIDKPWLKYYPNPDIDITKIEKSIYQMLEENTQNNQNGIAMEYYGILIKYKDYLQRINDYARSFKVLGIKKGDIVPLVLPNQPECRMLIYALNILGAIPYPIAPSLPPIELERIICENEIKNLVMFNGFYEKYQDQMIINSLNNVISTTGKESIPYFLQKLSDLSLRLKGQYKKTELPKNSRLIPFNEFVSAKNSHKGIITPYYEPNYTAAIIGTSGTTGISKGVCLTNENLNAMALQHMLGDMNIEENTVLLDILIQSIGYGIAVMHYSGCCKIKSILIPTLEKDVAPLFIKHHPNHFTGGPVHAEGIERFMKNATEKELRKLQSALKEVKNWVSGGASLSSNTEKYLRENGLLIRQGYGCTEACGSAAYDKKIPGEENSKKNGTVGIPLMLTTISIFEPNTDKELKIGEKGEICITGPTVMKEYLNNKEETDIVLKRHQDGKIWMHTKDIGYIDEDGHVYIIDRIKNIFMRTGFNVHPSEITKVLGEIPNIEECYVMGIEHPKEQMVPAAFISVEKETDVEKLKTTLNSECAKKLEEPSIPYQYVFIKGKLPRNLGGKVDQKQLLELSGINYFENSNQDAIIIEIKTKTKG